MQYKVPKVLILIFLEDSFGDNVVKFESAVREWVLILIFLEDSFGDKLTEAKKPFSVEVLILIFLEDSFGDLLLQTIEKLREGLNPYFFGG